MTIQAELSPPSRNLWPSRQGKRRLGMWVDGLFRLLCQAAALLVVVLAVLLTAVLAWKSWLAIRTIGIRFLTSMTWDPEPSHRRFGALAFVYGTVATSVIAMVIAVPLGVGTATCLSEVSPGWLRRVCSPLVEMLAAVPSVVYGFWGLFVVAPALQRLITGLGGPNQGGVGILSAGFVLSIMVVPYVASTSFDALRAVPRSQREAGLALGATRWQTIWSLVLPYAWPGILGGSFIALGRALGETMAVTMLIGNRPDISLSPFAMGNSIASVIANEFTEATYDLYLSALVELGLVLLLVSVAMNSLARLLIWRVSGDGRGRSLFDWNLLSRKQASTAPASAVPEVAEGSAPASGFTAPDAPETTAAKPHISTRSLVLWPESHIRHAHWADRLMTVVLEVCLVITVLPLFLILGYLIYRGVGALDWNFFVELPAPVGQAGGGMANALYGSLLLVGLAVLFSVPVGLFAAIYLAEYRSARLGPTVRFIGDLLGGVPSIVIGIFAYAVVVKPMGHFSGWAGGFALGVMMIPIFMRVAEDALRMVPQTIRHASYALGASRWQVVTGIVVPAAQPALITALFLAIARVAGETAPLLLTASSNQFWPSSPGDFTPSLPVYIFTYAVSPYEDWHRQAWAAALVLLVAVMLLNFGVRVLSGKRSLAADRDD